MEPATPAKKKKLAVIMDSDVGGVLIALFIAVVIFAVGMATYFLR